MPEDRFLEASEAVLHALDRLWLNDSGVSDATAISIREALASKLASSWVWRRLTAHQSTGIDTRLAGPVAAMFMGRHIMGSGPRCYVSPTQAAHADQVLPILSRLVEHAAGSAFVAFAFLDLLKARPSLEQLKYLVPVVEAWWRVQGANSEFWNDSGIARRLVDWIHRALLDATSIALAETRELTAVVDVLVRSGSPMGRVLEERVSARRGSGGD
jgi:hypothetical protein